MSKKSQAVASESPASKFLWLVVAVLIVGGIAANYYYAQLDGSIRLVGWVVLGSVSLLIALRTTHGRRFWQFFKAAKNEMRKVVWPSRQHTFQMTMMIMGICLVFAIMMWGIDSLIQWALSFVISV